MATIGQMLGKAAVRKMKDKLYIPYCEHTQKRGDKCPHHCRPSQEFLKWQSQLREAKKIAVEQRRKQDPVEHLFDVIFGEGNH